MGVKGMAIGGVLGGFFGGALGAIIGAAIGNYAEKEWIGAGKARRAARGRPDCSDADARQREAVFCASAAAMLAKMAKADGHVTRVEIASVEAAFARLGFSAGARRYAVDVFRKAKDDTHSIYEYATEFAAAVDSVEVRELFYELLWDLACADGTVSSEELDILRNVPRALGINAGWFGIFASDRLQGWGRRGGFGGGSGRRQSAPPPPPRDALAEAYQILGVSSSASDAAVKKAYREKAKKYHPDTLRAQGLPEEMVKKATDMMAKVNAAWSEIEKARHL